MAGREGLEPSNASSKGWCLTNLATAQRSDQAGSSKTRIEPASLNVLNISAERETWPSPAHHYDPQYSSRALDKRHSDRASDFEMNSLADLPGINRCGADKRCYGHDFLLSMLMERSRFCRFCYENARFRRYAPKRRC